MHLYPADEWRIVEARYSDEFVGLTETVFSLGNGFVGVRGSFEEGRPALVPGTFVNGFHEKWPIVHAEGAHALARTGQTIVNVPDTTILKLYVDDEPFFLPTARIRGLRAGPGHAGGTLTRELVWVTDAGKHVRVRSRRIVSLEHRHLVAMTYEVTMLDRAGARRDLLTGAQPPGRPPQRPARGTGPPIPAWRPCCRTGCSTCGRPSWLTSASFSATETTSSGMTLGIGVDHVIDVGVFLPRGGVRR